MSKYTYVVAAFTVDKARSVRYAKYLTPEGAGKSVEDALVLGCDYISVRRIRH